MSRTFGGYRMWVLALLLLCGWAAQVTAQQVARDVPTFMAETQKRSPLPDRIGIVWWMPEEFWYATQPEMPPAQRDAISQAVSDYLIVAVADGNVGAFGGFTFFEEDHIRATTRVLDRHGTTYTPLDSDTINSDVTNMISAIRPILSNALGAMGENLQVLLFPAYGDDGVRIADAGEEGSFTVELSGAERLTWRLPLGSVLPPKLCPVDGEQLSGAWTYCPFHGTELVSGAGATELSEPIRLGGNIPPPTKTKDVAPIYPPAAQEAGIQGVVVLEAIIGVEGTVIDLTVTESVPELDDAAITAVQQWEYTPTLLNGVAVPVIMTVTVNFSMR